MIDFQKLDRADIMIASEPLTPEERKRFSEFLKANREKYARSKSSQPAKKVTKLKKS